jgi:hypothetical protein
VDERRCIHDWEQRLNERVSKACGRYMVWRKTERVDQSNKEKKMSTSRHNIPRGDEAEQDTDQGYKTLYGRDITYGRDNSGA